MGSANISQMLAEMRQLVMNLQHRERIIDMALAKSQIVSDKISGMKEVIRNYFSIFLILSLSFFPNFQGFVRNCSNIALIRNITVSGRSSKYEWMLANARSKSINSWTSTRKSPNFAITK